MKQSYDIFISYNHEDKKFVDQLIQQLRKLGVSLWMDSNLSLGDKLKEKIFDSIDNSLFFIPILSGRSLGSEWVGDEISYAIKKKKKILPLLLDGITPNIFRTIKWFDGFEEALSMQIDRNNIEDAIFKLIPTIMEEHYAKIQSINEIITADRQEYNAKIAKVELLEKEKNELLSKINFLNKKLDEHGNLIVALKSEKKDLIDQLNKIDGLEQSNQHLEQQLNKYKADIELKENEIEIREKQIRDHNKSTKILSRDVDYFKSIIDSIQSPPSRKILTPKEIQVDVNADGNLKKFSIDNIPATNTMFLEFLQSDEGSEWVRSKQNINNPNYLWYWYDDEKFIHSLANAPVFAITIEAALAYAKFKNKRLPTPKEWLHAFHFGKTETILPYSVMNLQYEFPPEISLLPCYKNSLGIFHMSGLVWEYCMIDSNNLNSVKCFGGSWGSYQRDISTENIHIGAGAGIKQGREQKQGVGIRLVKREECI